MDIINNELLKENLLDLTLSDIVTSNYKTAAVFEKYGLDFCCRGNKSVLQACEEKELNPEEIINQLKDVGSNHEKSESFDERELDFLVDYIINIHHKYVREIIPVLAAHSEKVASVHGANHPETVEIAKYFSVVYKDLKQHMVKEEQILFPYIKYLVNAQNNNQKAEKSYFGTIQNPIKMMEAEHESAGDLLYKIRELSNNYMPPEDACKTFIVYYKELKEFEEDLHQHVHLENNILFPKSFALEDKLINGNTEN